MGKLKTSILTILAIIVVASSAPFNDDVTPCRPGCDKCVPQKTSFASPEECLQCGMNDDFINEWPCNDSTACECRDEVIQCDAAVSITTAVANDACRKLCEYMKLGEVEEDEFEQSCKIEGYYINTASQRIHLEGDCFNQWIHGYSDEGIKNPSIVGGQVGNIYYDVASVSECQEMCQKESSCVYWSWRAQGSEYSKSYKVKSCLLKTYEIIEHTMGISLDGLKDTWNTIPSYDDRYRWCNMGLGFKCNGGGYECLKCKEIKCVYASNLHISGPKFCTSPADMCQLPTLFPPSQNISTTEQPNSHSAFPSTLLPSPTGSVSPSQNISTTKQPSSNTPSVSSTTISSTTQSEGHSESLSHTRPHHHPCHKYLRCPCKSTKHCDCCHQKHHHVKVVVKID